MKTAANIGTINFILMRMLGLIPIGCLRGTFKPVIHKNIFVITV